MKLQNQCAIVTGGGRGIGREIALALAREGARVLLASRDQEAERGDDGRRRQAPGVVER